MLGIGFRGSFEGALGGRFWGLVQLEKAEVHSWVLKCFGVHGFEVFWGFISGLWFKVFWGFGFTAHGLGCWEPCSFGVQGFVV